MWKSYLTSAAVEADYNCIPIFPKNFFLSLKYLNGLKLSMSWLIIPLFSKITICLFQKNKICIPGWYGSVDWAPDSEAGGHWFDSR